MNNQVRQIIQRGTAIPAHPLALDSRRKLDERRQRALSRYYIAADVGGLAVGVHTTQFAIREPRHGLLTPVLTLAKEEMDRADATRPQPLVRVAGICGRTGQALAEASLAGGLGYHAGLLSLAALKDADDTQLLEHCRQVAAAIPIFGFYLQPAAGGRVLGYSFWRRLAELPGVVAIKIAPFNRYQTLDVVRAVAESGRDDLALYTGNDDSIVIDLLTPFRFKCGAAAESCGTAAPGGVVERRIVGGLLGHWSVWTQPAVQLFHRCRQAAADGAIDADLLSLAAQVTDCNAAFFDAPNRFAGCIAGLHEVLRRQGLLEGIWCLDEAETLSPGQAAEIDRVCRAYPHLADDDFVAQHKDRWLAG